MAVEYPKLPALPTTEAKYIIFRGKSIKITKFTDELWRDPQGTIMGFTDGDASVDPVTRCGVGVFSLPVDYWMTPACGVHDWAYSSRAWQAFHTREETDALLSKLGKLIPGHAHSITPEVFEMLAKFFGARFWDVKETNS